MPVKHVKTAIAAGLALCHLSGPEGQQRGQAYSAANDRAQAARIYKEMAAIPRGGNSVCRRSNKRNYEVSSYCAKGRSRPAYAIISIWKPFREQRRTR